MTKPADAAQTPDLTNATRVRVLDTQDVYARINGDRHDCDWAPLNAMGFPTRQRINVHQLRYLGTLIIEATA